MNPIQTIPNYSSFQCGFLHFLRITESSRTAMSCFHLFRPPNSQPSQAHPPKRQFPTTPIPTTGPPCRKVGCKSWSIKICVKRSWGSDRAPIICRISNRAAILAPSYKISRGTSKGSHGSDTALFRSHGKASNGCLQQKAKNHVVHLYASESKYANMQEKVMWSYEFSYLLLTSSKSKTYCAMNHSISLYLLSCMY